MSALVRVVDCEWLVPNGVRRSRMYCSISKVSASGPHANSRDSLDVVLGTKQ